VDKLVAMTSFVRIVEAGSLTAAADSLDTSLPTVVRTLASLERHLGVSLLKRTTRRMSLTEEGAQYFERCRVILSALQEAEETVVSRRTEPMGKLTLPLPRRSAAIMLPRSSTISFGAIRRLPQTCCLSIASSI